MKTKAIELLEEIEFCLKSVIINDENPEGNYEEVYDWKDTIRECNRLKNKINEILFKDNKK